MENPTVSIGSISDFDRHRGRREYTLPGRRTPNNIVGIGIANSDDHVYAWYDDLDGLKVSSGWSENLDHHINPRICSLPSGKSAKNILSIAIASDDHVYIWFTDCTVCSGTSTNLDEYFPLNDCRPPADKNASDVRAIGIRKSDDHVFYVYNDGTYSSGTSTDWDLYDRTSNYRLPSGKTPYDLVDVDFSKDDNLYVWYHGNGIGKGWPDLEREADNIVAQWFRDNPVFPGITIAASKQRVRNNFPIWRHFLSAAGVAKTVM